jgi:type 1 glutamine amidotransferase
MPATLDVADSTSNVTAALPKQFVSPANEWYSWNPSPRKNPDIRVMMTLDPKNYPLGFKDTLTGGDIPVTWTNTKYRMIYTNMGHGSKIFDDPQQNDFFARALLWLGRGTQ